MTQKKSGKNACSFPDCLGNKTLLRLDGRYVRRAAAFGNGNELIRLPRLLVLVAIVAATVADAGVAVRVVNTIAEQHCPVLELVKDGYQMPFENPSPLLASPSPSRSVMYT